MVKGARKFHAVKLCFIITTNYIKLCPYCDCVRRL